MPKRVREAHVQCHDLATDCLMLGNGNGNGNRLAAQGARSNCENHLGWKIRFNHSGAPLIDLATKALACSIAKLASISSYANTEPPVYGWGFGIWRSARLTLKAHALWPLRAASLRSLSKMLALFV